MASPVRTSAGPTSAGHPSGDPDGNVLTDRELRIIRAIGQTMFPRDGVLGIDGEDAHVTAWVDDYMGRMTPLGRAQVRALVTAFDVGYAAWSGRPRDVFAAALPADRAAYLDSWERSATYTQRMLYEALRAMFTFAYVDSDVVRPLVEVGRPTDRGERPDHSAPNPARAAEEA